MMPKILVLLVVLWVVLGPYTFTLLVDTFTWRIDSFGIESGVDFFFIFTMPFASIIAIVMAFNSQKQKGN